MDLIQSLFVIFGMIGAGVICERMRLFSMAQMEGIEVFILKIAMPCYLFTTIITHDLNTIINMPFIYSYLLSFLVIALIILLTFYKQDSASVLCIKILAAGSVSAAIYTVPVIQFLLGDPISGTTGSLVQFCLIIPIFITILNVINNKHKHMLERLMISFTTPLISFPIIGLLISYMQIAIHPVITSIVQGLGNGAAGLALFSFGLTFAGTNLTKEDLMNKDILFSIFLKNLIHPIVSFLIGKYIFDLDSYWLYSLVIATSAPTAFLTYLLAKQYALEKTFVRLVLGITSICSLVTLVVITILISK